MTKPIVQSLWIGDKLSTLEILCIKSFLLNGYDYHLYTYNNISNIPENTIVKDGNEILDKSEIYTYQNTSYSAISNHFRFELLYKKGGIWVDTDVVCVKPYITEDPYIIISESNKKYDNTEKKIGASILKFPQYDPILLEAIELCKQAKKDILEGKLVWGLGPRTVKMLVEKYDLNRYIKSWYFANSCSCHHVESIMNPNFTSKDPIKNALYKYSTRLANLPNDTYFVHLWNEFWRRNNINKNNFPKNTLIGDLCDKYYISQV